ncbi:MAG: NADH-quinone oxidoreductase subunit J [Syntrophothermus sp.]
MTIYDVIFYLFAAVTVVSAFFTVTVRNIVQSAFFLMLTLFGAAGLYVLLGSDFVAIVQLVVYIGGIVILLLFGVMLTNKITSVDIKTGTMQLLPASIGVGLFAGFLIAVVTNTKWIQIDNPIPSTTLASLGNTLMNEYVIAFELLGIILLIALVGAASLARK